MKVKKDFPYSYGLVTLRKKPLKSGGFSLYVDIYNNGVRKCETLKERLISEVTRADHEHNKQMVEIAQVYAQELNNKILRGERGFKTDNGILLNDLCDMFADAKIGKTKSSIIALKEHLNMCFGSSIDHIKVSAIDKDFCLRFIEYLKGASCIRKNEVMKPNSQRLYLQKFNALLNYAVHEECISMNPCTLIGREDKISYDETEREYLIGEEIKVLEDSCPKNNQVKNAFLFSCYTGLRISDIIDLKYGDINVIDGRSYIKKKIIKTKRDLIICIPEAAMKFIDMQDKKSEDNVFDLPYYTTINYMLNKWVQRCGIKKHITFHCARHTFATLSLTAGVDLYTTSKLLGHANVTTTQIYAKIIDQKKINAADAISNFMNNK